MAPAESEPAAAGDIAVELAHAAAPRRVDRLALRLPAGATAADALRASGLAATLPAEMLDGLTLALWGRACAPGTVLRDGDRLELLRPLRVDPKEARRLRYRRDGLRKPARRSAGAAEPSGSPSR